MAAHFGAVGIVQRETRMRPCIQIFKRGLVKKSPPVLAWRIYRHWRHACTFVCMKR
jgi:hypothetical protein